MRFKYFVIMMAGALIGGLLEALHPGLGFAGSGFLAMAGLYADPATGAGKKAFNHPNDFLFPRTAEGVIPFGVAVMEGTDPATQALKFSGATGVFTGVAAHMDFTKTYGQYEVLETVDIAKSGIRWVLVDEAVGPGDPVRVVHTDGTGITAGHFATSAVAGKTAVLTNAEFRSSTSGAGLVALYLSGADYSLTADV